MPLVDGATAAGFSIVRLLGHGQIGELYLAEHPRLPRQDALKIVSAELSSDPEYRYRFKQETGRAAALWHPNIVSLYDRGEFEDRLWLSMHYVDGIDAARLLTDVYPEGMPPDLVVEIVAAIADALDYAHEPGLVHGNVNPSNILISNLESRRRRILLTGFGLPRRPDESNSLTQSNLGIGTVSYAAPEQLMDDSIDGRTDQYALACTAFHLLTGTPAFAHMNPAVVISKHLNEPPPQPGDVRPELTYFDTPFVRALKKNPTERFRRCRDFAKALESKDSLGPYSPNAGVAELLVGPATNGVADTQPPVPAAPASAEPTAPAAEVHAGADAPDPLDALPQNDVHTPDAAPDILARTEVHAPADNVAPPDALPDVDDDISLAEPDVGIAGDDDTRAAARRRRLLHTAGLGLAILTVAVGGTLGVMALRSASESHDAPTDVETPSPATTVPPAPVLPARPALPTVIPSPSVRAPSPVVTRPAPTTPSLAATTAPPVSSSAAPQPTLAPTTSAQPTGPHSPPSTPTAPAGLDTRPAVGVPCGVPGSTATSNAGVPVVCADTPGGSAWEPPGG